MTTKYKFCTGCNQLKTVGKFYKSTHRKDGLYCHCKECQKGCVKNWISRNKEKHYVYTTNWNKKNPEKMKEIWHNYNKRRRSQNG
jgi:hypothetical protein